MTRLRDICGPGFTQAEYLRVLRAGHETGWWDENGVPAPWPNDFDEWRPIVHEPVTPEPGEPAF
jgi:hypothetical protein